MKKILILLVCLSAIVPIESRAQSEAARLEKLERAVEQLQKQNTQLESGNAELKREVATLRSHGPFAPVITEEEAPSPSDGKGYVDRGQAPPEKKLVYVLPGGPESKLTLGGFIQAQYEASDIDAFQGRFSDGPSPTRDRFRLRRARINLSGDFAENFDFKLEGDFALNDTGITVRDPTTGKTLASNSTRLGFAATDIFINWHQLPELNVKVGQYKAPFGYEQLTPDTKLMTLERSQPTNALTPDRQVGIEIWGKPLATVLPAQKDLLTYYAGAFNGTGRNISVNDNNEFMYVGRLELQPFTGKLFNQEAFVKFGVNGLTSRDDAGTVVSPAGNLVEASDGTLAAFTLTTAGERNAYGFDAALHVGPFDLSGEYLNERISPRTVLNVPPAFDGFTSNGYYIQGGYFIFPKKLQLVGKWESFNPGQLSNDDIDSVTGGLTYYVRGDNIKLAANYVHTWSDFRDGNPSFSRSQFNEVLVRLQVVF